MIVNSDNWYQEKSFKVKVSYIATLAKLAMFVQNKFVLALFEKGHALTRILMSGFRKIFLKFS